MVMAERPGAVRAGAGTLSDAAALGRELEQSLVDGLAAGCWRRLVGRIAGSTCPFVSFVCPVP